MPDRAGVTQVTKMTTVAEMTTGRRVEGTAVASEAEHKVEERCRGTEGEAHREEVGQKTLTHGQPAYQ